MIIETGCCFLKMSDAEAEIYYKIVRGFVPFYSLEVSYFCDDVVIFNGKFYKCVKLTSKIKNSGNYKQTLLGFYEPIMEKFRKVENMKELKAGQWVKCIKSCEFWGGGAEDDCEFYRVETGKWYKVCNCDFNILTIYNENKKRRSMCIIFILDCFDLNNPLDYNPDNKPKFKVGDKVKVIAAARGSFGLIDETKKYIGKEGIIDAVDSENYTTNISGLWWYRKNELEFIKEKYEPITTENIANVLRYNNIEYWTLYPDKINIDYKVSVHFLNPKWLQHLELEVGKLNPLPKKEKEPTFEEAFWKGEE